MNFKISSLAIRNPIPIIVLFLLLTILGIRAFQGLPINADPDMRFPMVNITVTQMGAATVLSSLLVARLATSLLAAYLLQPTAAKTSAITSSSKLKVYLTLLAKALHFRKNTLLLGGVFFSGIGTDFVTVAHRLYAERRYGNEPVRRYVTTKQYTGTNR